MKIKRSSKQNAPMKVPNGPRIPRAISAIKFMIRPTEYLDTYAERYGDPFRVGGGKSPPAVYFSNPVAIEEIFSADAELFEPLRGDKVVEFLLGKNSVVLLEGERHVRQRRLLTPPFHGARMRAYGTLTCELTEQMMSEWRVGKPFIVRSSMQDTTLRIILRAVFGLDDGSRFQQLRQLLCSLLDTISTPLNNIVLFSRSLQRDWGPLSPWGRFGRRKNQIDKILYDEIHERREHDNFSGTDILSLLMSGRDSAGQPMTENELLDELKTLLFAGHETTASALTWALYWIHQLPEVQDKLRQELGQLSDGADSSVISQLPYLSAVCQETLRIYPTALNAVRVLKSPLEIMGYRLEPGTLLIACIYLTHHREDLYPEPKRFRPERFLERRFSQYEYLPFGGGYRRCIGMAFAPFVMKLVLATILSRWQLELMDRRPSKPVRRGLTVAPPHRLSMVPIRQHRMGSPG